MAAKRSRQPPGAVPGNRQQRPKGQKGPSRANYELAIAALLSESTIEAAARKAKVGYRTLKRWLTLPRFQAAYSAARQALVERTVAGLLAITSKAVETLSRNMRCGQPGAENRAAELALAQAFKGAEVLDLARQIAEIKEQVREAEAHGHSNFGSRGRAFAAGPPPAFRPSNATAGQAAGGPGTATDAGGDDAGPLADGPAPLF